MATIRKEIHTTATPSAAWEALRDVGALHSKLVVGFVTATRLEGPNRIVTFANGMEARERIVAVDEARRRVAYSVIGGRFTHHNASAEVLPDGAGSTIVWTLESGSVTRSRRDRGRVPSAAPSAARSVT